MKKLLVLTGVLIASFVAIADDPLPEGGPYKETVAGIEWTFMVDANLNASVESGPFSPAISTSTTGDVVIPSVLGGRNVKSIGMSAFSQCAGLTGVIIPDGVTRIGLRAFCACSGLTDITIPSSVTEIEGVSDYIEGAFEDCSDLKNVKMFEGLERIGFYAFKNCASLTNAVIPTSVKTIQMGAFYACPGLQDDQGFVIKKSILFDYFGSASKVIIPDGVVTIGGGKPPSGSFAGRKHVTSVIIPDSVTTIEQWAFNGSGLTSVAIPSNVTSIGWIALECDNLNAVDFEGAPPAGVTNAGIKGNAAIRYNVKYQAQWVPVISAAGWTNAKPYDPFPPKINDCITFSSASAFTLKTKNGKKNWNDTLWTSTDKMNWAEWKGEEISSAQVGSTDLHNLYVRGSTSNTKITGDYVDNAGWIISGTDGVSCSGNIETLRGATGNSPSLTQMADYCYAYMFMGCASLLTAPILPATTLSNDCYEQMFYGCTSLVAAPELPAMTLSYHCYFGMFYGCKALTKAPELPAMTLGWACYYSMFDGCTSLMAAPRLPATTLDGYCYMQMFQRCSSLTNAPALPASTLMEYCYANMFSGCTLLTTSPELHSTTLADSCYDRMFQSCSALTNAPALPATTLADSCYEGMFAGCTSLSAAPSLLATTLADKCYNGMFSGCTSLEATPELPAMALTYGCYSFMFKGCTSLTDAPKLPATTLSDYCYDNMFYGCTALEVNSEAPGKEWKIPAISTTASFWGSNMFYGTKGTLQGQPALNTTYYIKSAPPMPGSKENPWPIGAGTGDTVEAWTNGTTLVVQGAGKMMDFDAEDSVVPWPVEQIAAVEIAGSVASIGQNAWLGLADSVIYNGISSGAMKTMSNGFGGTTQYARTAFKEFLVNGASINATVALETAKSLTNEWTEVELTDEDVHVENGRIVIQHESAPQSQGFYLLQPTE